MPRVIEGYVSPDRQAPPVGSDSWVWGLRREARRALIRRLTLERVRDGGLEDGPQMGGLAGLAPSTTRVIEGVVIGVGVMVLGAWLCGKLKIGIKKGR